MASINSNVFKVCITFEGCGFYYHSKDISYDREKAFFFKNIESLARSRHRRMKKTKYYTVRLIMH